MPLRTERALGKVIGKVLVAIKNTSEAARSERDRAQAKMEEQPTPAADKPDGHVRQGNLD